MTIKSFATKFPIEAPVKTQVFDDYDHLDDLAKLAGYHPVRPDERVELSVYQCRDNHELHAGWIALMDSSDQGVNAAEMLEGLNERIQICQERGETVIVGFCQTGSCSIGYTIYVKGPNPNDAN